jgi:hypothetical protein
LKDTFILAPLERTCYNNSNSPETFTISQVRDPVVGNITYSGGV